MKWMAPLAALLVSCSTSVPPTNPFDTQTPPSQQARGTVRGVVDPAVVPGGGETVRLHGTGTSEATTVADAIGAFVFADVQPGTYSVELRLPGFETLTLLGIEVLARPDRGPGDAGPGRQPPDPGRLGDPGRRQPGLAPRHPLLQPGGRQPLPGLGDADRRRQPHAAPALGRSDRSPAPPGTAVPAGRPALGDPLHHADRARRLDLALRPVPRRRRERLGPVPRRDPAQELGADRHRPRLPQPGALRRRRLLHQPAPPHRRHAGHRRHPHARLLRRHPAARQPALGGLQPRADLRAGGRRRHQDDRPPTSWTTPATSRPPPPPRSGCSRRSRPPAPSPSPRPAAMPARAPW